MIRKEWNLEAETIAIGIIGRIHPLKDYPNFLQAAAILVEQEQNIACFCFGTGAVDYQEAMYSLTKELNLIEKVRWMGVSDDIPSVCNALDLVVSSSTNGEGFGNVIGEAMASGTPCIVTDVGDSALIVGDSRLVVPRQNPEELARSINQFIETKRRDYDFNTRQRIVEHFSITQLALNSKAVFLQLLER
ncbi:MAG: glycosyltransferase [Pleurocapsa sp.]